MGRHQVGGGLCWGCGHQWGTAQQGLAMGSPVGRQRGAPIRLSACGLTPSGEATLASARVQHSTLPLGLRVLARVCLGAAEALELSINLISASRAHHILRQQFPIQKMGPGPALGSRVQADSRRNPNSAMGLTLSLVPSPVPLPRFQSRGQGGGLRVRGCVGPGMGPPAPRWAPTPALAHSLFLRKTELPKQINQPVKKKPWRKNLSTLPAKKLKRGIVLRDGGGDNSHLLPQPFACGCPSFHVFLGAPVPRVPHRPPHDEELLAWDTMPRATVWPRPSPLTMTPSSETQSLAQSEEAWVLRHPQASVRGAREWASPGQSPGQCDQRVVGTGMTGPPAGRWETRTCVLERGRLPPGGKGQTPGLPNSCVSPVRLLHFCAVICPGGGWAPCGTLCVGWMSSSASLRAPHVVMCRERVSCDDDGLENHPWHLLLV